MNCPSVKRCNMIVTRWVILSASLTLSVSCPSVAVSKSLYKVDTFDVRGSRYFSKYNTVVGQYLREHSSGRRARACVVGQKTSDRRKDTAWVIWRGGDKLILWWGGGDDDLNRSSRLLSIRNDVVEDIGTSTYRESRVWFDKLEHKCKKFGRYVNVN